jgi:hypothetical protein
VDEYREGKVKSTPMRGVKQFLKPDAYKQLERGSPKVSRSVQLSVISYQLGDPELMAES